MKRANVVSEQATKTCYYFGSSCEREVVAGVTTQYIWIGGDAYTAVAVAKKVGTGTWTVYNIFRDHLGTITHLKTGSTVTEYSFDAWGRRRDKDDWTYTLTSEPALFADRGFTGHEYLEDFKLYNMNGRLYDPVVGRFLSPDPYVQDPGFTQSLNRYSYCLNNPLKFTDPTGEKLKWPKFEWRYLIPVIGQLDYVMQTINDNTTQLRQNMTNAGIPSFGIGTSVNFAGNVNINGSIYGQQVFNTANIDRSGPSVKATYEELAQVRKDYGKELQAVRDATRISINLTMPGVIHEGTSVGIWGIGDVMEVGGAIKPNNATPIIGWGITLYNAGSQINNGDYVEATWTIIEGAGGIYSVGAKGLYQLSQTQYMQQGVNQIFYQNYLYNQNQYELTGNYSYRVRALHYNKLMRK